MVCINRVPLPIFKDTTGTSDSRATLNGRKVTCIHHSTLKAVVRFDLQQNRVSDIHSATQPPLHARRSPRIKRSRVRHGKSHLTIRRKNILFLERWTSLRPDRFTASNWPLHRAHRASYGGPCNDCPIFEESDQHLSLGFVGMDGLNFRRC